jgi:GTP-binding protein
MDARRPLTELDWNMIGWFAPGGRPIHCLLSKSDKLTRQEQAKTLRDARKALAEANLGDQVSLQLFSSLKKTGIDEVEKVVGGWLDDAQAALAALSGESDASAVKRDAPDGNSVENGGA